MIEIKKGKEPSLLLQYRQQKNATCEDMDTAVKNNLLGCLLHEQGHLCAYCMKRIPETRKLPNGVAPVSIEHWRPRNPINKSPAELHWDLNYKNMLAVCSGNRGCGDEKGMTCDARRGNAPMRVNPCDPNTLRDISYTSKGRIYSSDPEIDKELNELLNLNSENISLPECRERALQAFLSDLKKRCKAGNISTYKQKKLAEIRGKNPQIPYVGIIIWWLEKHR